MDGREKSEERERKETKKGYRRERGQYQTERAEKRERGKFQILTILVEFEINF